MMINTNILDAFVFIIFPLITAFYIERNKHMSFTQCSLFLFSIVIAIKTVYFVFEGMSFAPDGVEMLMWGVGYLICIISFELQKKYSLKLAAHKQAQKP